MKVNGDPHSISKEDVAELRALDVNDAEIVEIIEVLNTGNNTNVLCDALDVPSDTFLAYASGEAPAAAQTGMEHE
jgi:alkylhydroperoxidase family enzyme